jgi:hypothetical protein
MNVFFLCREQDLQREPLGYVRAFRKRGEHPIFVPKDCRLDEDINYLLSAVEGNASLIIQPETDLTLLPRGLNKVKVPTACFHFDPYAYLHRRVRWSMLFDYAVVFHLGFEESFRRAGHPNPVTIAHAVDAEFFTDVSNDRMFDVGWVGRSRAAIHKRRRQVLEVLARNFRMNDWEKIHSYSELAHAYCRSKIVVNVGRDDYPEDVSLRFAEAMAAGALFITLLPSEMDRLGFQEGVHFVGARTDEEILEFVRYYVGHEAEREKIARAGREKVLAEHTYDQRANQLLTIVEQNEGKLFAPARGWPEERIALTCVDYYCAHAEFGLAAADLWRVARADLGGAAMGAGLMARAIASRARGRLNAALQWSK